MKWQPHMWDIYFIVLLCLTVGEERIQLYEQIIH